jgi:RNA polymerase sigma-70 factor (ECF subfamily)
MESYARHGRALVRKAERLLQNPDDALDVVQGLFLDLLSAGGPEPELPYLYRAVTNRCLTLLRDRKNRHRILELQMPALRGPVRTGVEEELVSLDLLAKLVDRLDQESCELLVLHYFDDLSQGEIAELVGTSRKTIVRRMARLRDVILEVACEETPA